MAASRNQDIESKESKGEIVLIKGGINHPLFDSTDVLNVIDQYRGSYASSSAWVNFFRDSTLKEEILMTALHGGDVKPLVQKARGEKHLPDTLIQAAVQAIRDCDVSLRDDRNVVIYEGMAENLLQLCCDLFPDRFSKELFPKFQKQAKLAAPLEEKEQKTDKARCFQAEVKKVFDANKENNDKTLIALQAFNDWAKKLSAADKIIVIYLAIVELANRGAELPGRWHSPLGDRFCKEVLWDALQKNLPPRQQQIFVFGIYYVFNPRPPQKLIRSINLDSPSIAYPEIFYTEFGERRGLTPDVRTRERLGSPPFDVFLKLIRSNNFSVQTLCYGSSDQFIAQRATACDLESLRSAAMAMGQ